MFQTPLVMTTFKKMNLKLATVQDETKRLAELQFVVEPFPAVLAREVSENLAAYLFSAPEALDATPRGDVTDLTYALAQHLWRMRINLVPDSDVGQIRIEPVGLRPLKVHLKDPDADVLQLVAVVTAVHVIDPSTPLRDLVEQFGNIVHLTFERMQPDLLDADVKKGR